MSRKTNASLWQRREAAVPRGVGSMHQRFAASASNAGVTDIEGRRYIDFAAGIAVTNTGHGDPRIVAAVKHQLDRYAHVCFQVTPYEPYVELAERLNAAAPGAAPKKTIFLTTGAEAVENAVKIARAHTGRRAVVAFRGGFHGRTMMALALTGKVAPYKASFGPMPGEVYHAQYPCEYLGIDADAAFASLDGVFKADVEPSSTAAIIIEPVLGEGGFYMAPPAFMQRLRAFCDSHGIVLIADEIQTGFARTGKLFAVEHSGIAPDLITCAKALGGGFPISAVTGRAEIMDAPAPGGLGGTYGGPPLSCAAGLEVLKIIEADDLCARADAIGAQIKKRLTRLREAGMACIGDIRGPGAMVAMEMVVGGDAGRPDAALTAAIVREAANDGLILLSCGVRGNVIRFLPPLTAPDSDIRAALDILEGVLKRLCSANQAAAAQ